MLESEISKIIGKISLFIFITVLFISIPTHAQYSGGTGEPNDPYQIAEPNDWVELMNTSTDWDKNFIMTNDIDVNGLSLTPVGTSYNHSFKGIFDGKNHIISNANINMPDSDYVGIFGYVGSNGQINSIGLENIKINGNYYVGGLVGYNWRGDITNCYSSGTVSGDYQVGGLVGFSYGNITNCHSSGTVSGIQFVGGLVGSNWYSPVTQCYSTGVVKGNAFVGGLVGRNLGNVNDCFWDIETSNTLDGVGNMDPDPNGVVGKTTSEMQTRSTFTNAGWDFIGETNNGSDDIWWINEGVDYPRLWWELSTEN